MTEEQKAAIAALKGDPEFIAIVKDLIPTDEPVQLKSALEKEREMRKQLEKEKKQLETLTEAEKAKALEEQGKFKELYEKTLKENETLRPMADYKDKYEAIQEARKAEILTRLPEERREAYKDFELNVLEVVVKDLQPVQVINTPGTENSKTGTDTIDFSKMDFAAISELATSNPDAYNTYLNKHRGK